VRIQHVPDPPQSRDRQTIVEADAKGVPAGNDRSVKGDRRHRIGVAGSAFAGFAGFYPCRLNRPDGLLNATIQLSRNRRRGRFRFIPATGYLIQTVPPPKGDNSVPMDGWPNKLMPLESSARTSSLQRYCGSRTRARSIFPRSKSSLPNGFGITSSTFHGGNRATPHGDDCPRIGFQT
jgi:hypothetical protein